MLWLPLTTCIFWIFLEKRIEIRVYYPDFPYHGQHSTRIQKYFKKVNKGFKSL